MNKCNALKLELEVFEKMIGKRKLKSIVKNKQLTTAKKICKGRIEAGLSFLSFCGTGV
jgi:hypothetical protein